MKPQVKTEIAVAYNTAKTETGKTYINTSKGNFVLFGSYEDMVLSDKVGCIISYEERIAGKTTYTDEDGDEHYHTKNSKDLKKLKLLKDRFDLLEYIESLDLNPRDKLDTFNLYRNMFGL